MGIYAGVLTISNYLAPVLCGFIAQYQSWPWAFYWPAIFIAGAFVWVFFFLEETNYARDAQPLSSSGSASSASVADGGGEETESGNKEPEASPGPEEKQTVPGEKEAGGPDFSAEERGVGRVVYHKKSYIRKLALWSTHPRNNMFRRAWQSVYYLSWPVIFYAG